MPNNYHNCAPQSMLSAIGLIDFLDVPSEIFSPDSGGSVNVRNSMDEIMAQGTTRLNV
jgi:hypothetical protein